MDPRAQPGPQGWGTSVISSGEIQESRAAATAVVVRPPCGYGLNASIRVKMSLRVCSDEPAFEQMLQVGVKLAAAYSA